MFRVALECLRFGFGGEGVKGGTSTHITNLLVYSTLDGTVVHARYKHASREHAVEIKLIVRYET